MPIGTDLVLNEGREPEKVRLDGAVLGQVVARSARRWNTPLAIPLMDLRLEKFDLLALAGIGEAEAEAYHFSAPIDDAKFAAMCGEQTIPLCPGSAARNAALTYIGAQPDLVPVGMAIGPFSLATRLMADPITATALAGRGTQAEDSADVSLLWQCLRIAESAVLRSLRSQIASGAQAIMICEPAACTAFISPRQLKAGSNIFEDLVMEPNLRLKKVLDEGRAGDNGGLLLRGVEKDEVERGQVIAKPGSIKPHANFKGEVYVLSKEEGGRHTPFFKGYRPQFYFRTTDVTGVAQLPEGTEMVMPGDNVQLSVELITPVAMDKGLRFAIREGGRTVGAGTVSEVTK